jgi:Flp pilus assembly protein protease CpaA
MIDGPIDFFSADPGLNPILHLYLRDGMWLEWLAFLAILLGVALLWGTFTDLFRGKRIHNSISYIAMSAGLVSVPLVFTNWQMHYLIALVFGGSFLVLSFMGAMGMGDVKFILMFSLLFGLAGVLLTFLAFILAATFMLPFSVWLKFNGKSLKRYPVPMGPFFYLAYILILVGIGMPEKIVTYGLAGLVAVLLIGMSESKFRPMPSTEKLFDTWPTNDWLSLRFVAGSPIMKRIEGSSDWHALDEKGKKHTNGDIHFLLTKTLSWQEELKLDEQGHFTKLLQHEDEQWYKINVVQVMHGYTVEIEPQETPAVDSIESHVEDSTFALTVDRSEDDPLDPNDETVETSIVLSTTGDEPTNNS